MFLAESCAHKQQSGVCPDCPVRARAICSALAPAELEQFASIMQTVTLAEGEALFNEGETGDYLYNLTSGAVKIYKLLPDGRRQMTGFLFPGDFIGFAVSDTYVYSAETLSEVTVCRFPRTKLERMLESYPHLHRRLFTLASRELATAQDQMLLLGRKSAKEKVASFLLSLRERAIQRGEDGNPLYVPMSRSDIADYLGLTTETVSRTVTQLKTSGAIRLLEGHRFQIKDVGELQLLAEGA
ncbi:Crp/Fnr family transcriptional regulator [Radicibacter daui]|uniref:Crp/Fnr family transcriptional regulator n=1 Tax=Radicibacter daui TaxID=3064829 RepID=UPI004046ADA5